MASRKTLQRRRHMRDLQELAALSSHLIDQEEVSAFADRIVDLSKLSSELVLESVKTEPPPPSIGYVRIFNPGDAEPFLQCVNVQGKAVSLVTIVSRICERLDGAGRLLSSTRVLPTTHPGIVDIEIHSVSSQKCML